MDVSEDFFVPVYHSLLTTKNNDIVHYNNEISAKAESLLKLMILMVLNLLSPW